MTAMKQSQWQAIVASIGPEQAAQWRARNGVEVVPDNQLLLDDQGEYDEELPPEDDAASFAVPGMTAMQAVGGPEPEDEGADAASFAVENPNGRMGARDLQALLTQQRRSIGSLYDSIAANIQQQYRAPSAQDMVLAYSLGMLQPDQEGDGGAVSRGLRAVGQVALDRRNYSRDMAKTMADLGIKKAEALANLEGKYLTASMRTPPSPFSYQLDQSGGVREVPKNVHRPVTKEEYDAIPVGDYYLVPSGAEAGKVIRKLPQ